MKLNLFPYLFMLLFLAACSVSSSNTEIPENTIPAKVDRVVDGDTLKVTMEDREETIRLLLVDTPETKHPSKPVQPFGPEASQFAKEQLEGKKVGIEIDVSERDKYGRLLAYIWIGDQMFNEMLLEEGLARVAYIYQPNVKYVDQFQKIQRQAQEEGKGIWSLENYVQEEGFNEETETPDSSTSEKDSDEKCLIKGNINSKGEKIYHVPEGSYYEITKAEEMFCSTTDAEAAGFRPSSR
ncbi:thermonuclease family protein [Bacillus sp. RAR_GA_16]|uniref:thermonuclease family protein n=1 Tax=Bacillus sp. RAR_GA_16 TaxID=2876774 RepID=UPI001CCDB93A|nr:thermonuclease family protein [Bacillus sp. RAR_GA_16]MCA0171476.1 thermonuclease family protein [Bacillus sp. RAR_GA_16]